MDYSPFLDLAEPAVPEEADVLLLPLPFEGTACYGKGTADAPRAIWKASTHIEDWDEETSYNLSDLAIHSAESVLPEDGEEPGAYLERVREMANRLQRFKGLVLGIGGEHSLTPALVKAALNCGVEPRQLTVVQFDAHADLRDSYESTRHSHACAMRRVVDMGAKVLAIGIRSAQEEEMRFGLNCGRVETFYAHDLSRDGARDCELKKKLRSVSGPLYLTFDIDGLEVHLCPATGTPLPGGLGWWQAMAYLRSLLFENGRVQLVGADLVETVPSENSQVNEIVAARLICKVLAYWFSSR